MTLTFHHLGIGAFFCEIDHFENVPVITCLNGRGTFYFPEMIYTQVVCNTHSPGKEFSFFRVTAAADCVDNFDKNVLEDVLGKVFVLYEEENGGVQLILVPDD